VGEVRVYYQDGRQDEADPACRFGLLVNPPIGETLADNALHDAGRALAIVDTQGDAIAVA